MCRFSVQILSLLLVVFVSSVLTNPLPTEPTPEHGGEHHEHEHKHEHAVNAPRGTIPVTTPSSRHARDTDKDTQSGVQHDHDHDHDHVHEHEHDHQHNHGAKAAENKPRTARDTTQATKEKVPEHPATVNKEEEEPVHLKLSESSLTTLVGGKRVVRDDKAAKLPAVPDNAPGPFLVRGEPIQILLPTDSPTPLSTSQQTKPRSRREDKQDTLPHVAPTQDHQHHHTDEEDNSKTKNPLLQAATPPRHKRETSTKPQQTTTKITPVHEQTKEEQNPTGHHPIQQTRSRRDTPGSQPGAPVTRPNPVTVKTEDGRDAIIAVPPIPGGPKPQEARTKRHHTPEHTEQQRKEAEEALRHEPAAVAPLSDEPKLTQEARPKRDHTPEHTEQQRKEAEEALKHEHGAVTPLSDEPKSPQEARQKRHHTPEHTEQQRKEAEDVLRHEQEEKEEQAQKEAKKLKRDTYTQAHKESSDGESKGVYHEHTNPSSPVQLAPPTQGSEYDRHVRATDTKQNDDSSVSKPLPVVHKADDEDDDDDDDDDDSSEEKEHKH